MRSEAARSGWTTYGDAARLWFARTTLRKTLKIAVVVGTLLSLINSLINQGSVIFGGNPTTATWVRVGLNYVVPFCVSSLGFLSATRRRTLTG